MKRGVLLAVLVGLLIVAAPQSAMAQAKPVYSYVEAGYNEVDVDNLPGDVSDDGNGGFAGAGVGFKMFHVFGQDSRLSSLSRLCNLSRAGRSHKRESDESRESCPKTRSTWPR